ncbi:MAG TPA: phospholipase domain-containing protein, partial [Chitinophagaceae bacterium]|nr:phospholipase domain-containing protein [Chitinophagaceae bacterium]
FILTYDENDGYFDHVPPFVAPHPFKRSTGLVSKSINTLSDYVASKDQQSNKEHSRESSIGLGYRVPLVIASPWSRGGWVNSQVFDHTSSLQFLEKFLSHKLKKKIEEPNITSWRRAVCGDLSSAFRPYNGEKLDKPEFLDKKEFIESIHKAQFKNPPSNFRKLSGEEIEKINKAPYSSPHMASQEKGIRSSCSLPYELYVNEKLSDDKRSISINFRCGRQFFGASSAGSPFQVYAPGIYKNEIMKVWDYAVAAGEEVTDKWAIDEFENGNYHLNVYGPNGFFREFKGNSNDPDIELVCEYESDLKRRDLAMGFPNILVNNNSKLLQTIEITDNAYGHGNKVYPVKAQTGKKPKIIGISTFESYNWYDFTVRIKGNKSFERRYAGRVETKEAGKTDPFMGRVKS